LAVFPVSHARRNLNPVAATRTRSCDSSSISSASATISDEIELLPRLLVRVATIGHLIALKVLARDDVRRPQDAGDLRALLRIATALDVSQARSALRLIADRGYDRGRDLQTELEKLLRAEHEPR